MKFIFKDRSMFASRLSLGELVYNSSPQHNSNIRRSIHVHHCSVSDPFMSTTALFLDLEGTSPPPPHRIWQAKSGMCHKNWTHLHKCLNVLTRFLSEFELGKECSVLLYGLQTSCSMETVTKFYGDHSWPYMCIVNDSNNILLCAKHEMGCVALCTLGSVYTKLYT